MLEVMVVIGIAATMMGLAVGIFGSSAEGELKSESSHLLASVRFLYNLSITTRRTYRLVFDLNEQKYWAEESESAVTLGTPEDATSHLGKTPASSEKSKKKDSGGALELTGEDADKKAAPPKGGFNLVDEDVMKRSSFSKEIKFKDYFVAHEPQGQTEGQAYLYFFPNGLTERAIIHLTDESEKRNFSIEVNPLTGRARITAEYVEWKEK